MESMVLLVAGLVAGAALGAIAMWLLNRRKEAGGSVARLKAENDRFKEEVTEHFVETARLINQLTDSYKAVFDHLSGGAEKLVDQEKLTERLPSVEGGEVRLYRIGASDSADEKSKTSRETGATADARSQPKTGSAPRPEERKSDSKTATPASATANASAAATASASGGTSSAGGASAESAKPDTSKPDTAKPDPAAPKSASETSSTSAKADPAESSGSADGKSDKSAEAESRASDNSESDDLKSGAEASDNTATSKPSERKDPLKKS